MCVAVCAGAAQQGERRASRGRSQSGRQESLLDPPSSASTAQLVVACLAVVVALCCSAAAALLLCCCSAAALLCCSAALLLCCSSALLCCSALLLCSASLLCCCSGKKRTTIILPSKFTVMCKGSEVDHTHCEMCCSCSVSDIAKEVGTGSTRDDFKLTAIFTLRTKTRTVYLLAISYSWD